MQKGVVRRVITNVGGVVSDKTDEILISLRTLRIKILNTLLHANDHAEQEKKGKKKTNKNKRTSYGQTINSILLSSYLFLLIFQQKLHHHMTKREIQYYFNVDDHDKGRKQLFVLHTHSTSHPVCLYVFQPKY